MAAIEQGGTIALANKEALVSAGEVMTRRSTGMAPRCCPSTASTMRSSSACRWRTGHVRSIALTAAVARCTWSRICRRSREQAIAHPNCTWARRSASTCTMFSKDLEQLSASPARSVWIASVSWCIRSVIHSMVEYRDGSTLAQLGPSDMRVPIVRLAACAHGYADGALDLPAIGERASSPPTKCASPRALHARPPRRRGGPAVLNAATNCVGPFSTVRSQPGIALLVEDVLNQGDLPSPPQTLEDVLRRTEAPTLARGGALTVE